jgi:hypothetical protein
VTLDANLVHHVDTDNPILKNTFYKLEQKQDFFLSPSGKKLLTKKGPTSNRL